ncbi:MAG: isoprenylcysteine carboxylmethyltransferase family protein [Coriobacteriia bacterium]|nr:isoprenylcysteine carboxylmethyltransferase family protein [Coriobacteriia bacterium]
MSCSTTGQARRRVMPPTYFLIVLVIVIGSRFVLGPLAYSTWLTLGLGAVLMAAGIALNLLADSAFKKRATPVSPDALPLTFVDSGVFRLTRNPMYLGMALIAAGSALLVGAPVGVLAALGFVVIMDRMFVPGEERNLELAFGGSYVGYRARVRRWI